ncbi:unnamed protein product [Rotaria sp. Silwood1]|nr:unnamed protein product [Rotaria sp. Silwood1]CAF0936357.1 unnamed protein product [Rotaria sp. Silwood1]CAF3366237.1 unnamed protein product [Rotaria sp. Silwood1]CAF4566917.1 unnamed protein product [Rotaria sp. Silwood1]
MTEEDISALVTSIDENDIEIIPSNGSDINDQLNFISEHFSIDNRNFNPPIVPRQTIQLNNDDSEEFEDETLIERLYGLTEMFPNWLQTFFQNSFHYSKYFGQFIKKTIWFCSSSFIILLLPILVQLEFSQVAEMEAAQTRQILLGPSAQIGSNFGFGQK